MFELIHSPLAELAALPSGWQSLPRKHVFDALRAATTWSEVDDLLRERLRVERWWRAIPYPGGPFLLSKLINTPHEERVDLFKKHGPGGRFEWAGEWNKGAF